MYIPLINLLCAYCFRFGDLLSFGILESQKGGLIFSKPVDHWKDKQWPLSEEKNAFPKKRSSVLTFDSYHSISYCHLGFSKLYVLCLRVLVSVVQIKFDQLLYAVSFKPPKGWRNSFPFYQLRQTLMTNGYRPNTLDAWYFILNHYAIVNFTVILYLNTRAIHW